MADSPKRGPVAGGGLLEVAFRPPSRSHITADHLLDGGRERKHARSLSHSVSAEGSGMMRISSFHERTSSVPRESMVMSPLRLDKHVSGEDGGAYSKRSLDSYVVSGGQDEDLPPSPSPLINRTLSNKSLIGSTRQEQGDTLLRQYVLGAILGHGYEKFVKQTDTASQGSAHDGETLTKRSVGSDSDSVVTTLDELAIFSHRGRADSNVDRSTSPMGGRESPGLKRKVSNDTLERKSSSHMLERKLSRRALERKSSTENLTNVGGQSSGLTDDERRMALNLLLGGEGFMNLPMVKRPSEKKEEADSRASTVLEGRAPA